MNVDTSAAPKDRVAALWDTIGLVVTDLDSSPSDNTKLFLLHVAWHEGAGLTARAQFGGGPGRSFYQFEPARARDAINYAESKGWAARLAQALQQDGLIPATTTGGDATQMLLDARDALPTTFGSPWPTSNPLVEQGLLGSDLFGTYLIRIDLRRIPAAIPAGNQGHAQYWADYWKIKFDSDSQKQALIATFKGEADTADGYLP
jgi:hypothetical protein